MFERTENGAKMECPFCGHVNEAEITDQKFSRTYVFQCNECISTTTISEYMEDGNPVFDITYDDEPVMVVFGSQEAISSLYEE